MRRAVRHQCPDRPGGLVRQGNRSDFLRAPGKQLDEPPALSTVPLDMADHGHGADYQHLAQIAVACPRDAAKPLLTTARVLLGYKADPCCHVPTALEDGGIGIGSIILATLDVGLHVLSRDQPNIMPQRDQLAGPKCEVL